LQIRATDRCPSIHGSLSVPTPQFFLLFFHCPSLLRENFDQGMGRALLSWGVDSRKGYIERDGRGFVFIIITSMSSPEEKPTMSLGGLLASHATLTCWHLPSTTATRFPHISHPFARHVLFFLRRSQTSRKVAKKFCSSKATLCQPVFLCS
jgi:hypothetical protein